MTTVAMAVGVAVVLRRNPEESALTVRSRRTEPPTELGWIEVLMTDADGRTWRFCDKPPISDATGRMTSGSSFPAPVTVRVRVIEEAEPMTVSTEEPDGITSDGL
jgi:hypothetical protein